MKITKIKTSAFGRLSNWESPDIDKDIVVITGFNESGKTTVFNLISTILYGWHPVLNNPYIPWESNASECESYMLDKDGLQFKVYRRLRSKAEGKLVMGHKVLTLNNGAIKQVSNLPFEVFSEVYALTIDQMGFPDYEVWQRLQDQILGGQYISFMRPVNEVISELQNEANALWRPDRQGKPKDKLLQEKLKDLRLRLLEAEKNDNSMRNLEEKLYNLNGELQILMNRKAKLIAAIDRAERLYPVQRKLVKINEMTGSFARVEEYGYIPQTPGLVIKKLEESKGSLEEELKRLTLKKEQCQGKKERFTAIDSKVYRMREGIKELSRSHSQAENDYIALKDIENESLRYTDRLQDRSKDFLKGGWRSETAGILETIDEAELRAAINMFKKNETQYNQLDARIGALKIRAAEKRSSRFMPAALLLILPAVTGIFLRNSASSVLLPVLSVTIFACALLAWWMLKSNGHTGIEIRETDKNLRKAGESKEASLERIKSVLRGLPIAEQRLQNPDETLLVDINTLKELYCGLLTCTNKRELIVSRLREKEHTKSHLLQYCGISTVGSLLKDITKLENSLNGAEFRYREYMDADHDLVEIDNQLSYTEGRISDINSQIGSITDGLNSMEGENLQDKISNLENLREMRQKAWVLKEELEHDYPDLEDIVREINETEQKGNTLVLDIDEIARIKTERDQIDLEVNRVNEEIGSVKKDLEQREKHDRMDEIKGQISGIEDERKEAAFGRDKLLMTKRILQEADRVYREENQPDVLLRAGNYIESISGGRYNQVFIKDDEQAGLAVKSSYADYPLEIKQPLSRGTVEQIYFALRLALLDHLDGDGERLPVFLDEVMVNWDESRMENGLKLLKNIAQNRQVFLFTCHKGLVDMLSGADEVQIINL